MKRPLVSILCGGTALLFGLAVGCGGDDSKKSSEESPRCSALGEVCHAVEESSDQAAECHELGHDGDPAVCEEQFDDCIDVCLEAITDEGGGEAGASGDDFGLCSFLASFCHHVEDELGQECHELGHDGDGDACLDRADECIHHCAEAPPEDEHGGEAGSHS